MQTSRQETKAYRSENLVYDLGIFTAKKVNFVWLFTLNLRLHALTFHWVKGACNVIPFKGVCALKCSAPLPGGIG